MAAYRMTPARRAALKKAQLASAKKRRGMGKGKVSSVRRRGKKATTSQVKRRRRAAVAAVGAIGAAAGAGYVYKNRERLIVAPAAELRAIRLKEKALGRKLTKVEKRKEKRIERKLHAQRSTFRAREYLYARRRYLNASKLSKGTKNIRPARWDANSIYHAYPTSAGKNLSPLAQELYTYRSYQKDRFVRAEKRLQRLHKKQKTALPTKNFSHKIKKTIALKRRGYIFAGKKTKGFDYTSGKQLKFRNSNLQGVYRSWW